MEMAPYEAVLSEEVMTMEIEIAADAAHKLAMATKDMKANTKARGCVQESALLLADGPGFELKMQIVLREAETALMGWAMTMEI